MRSTTRKNLSTRASMVLFVALVLAVVATESRPLASPTEAVRGAHAADTADGLLVLRMANAAHAILRNRLSADTGRDGLAH